MNLTPAVWLEALAALLLLVGAVFLLVGALGMVRFRDFFMRLHAPTKASTLGVGGVLLASMIYFAWFGGAPSLHELMITLFIFLTAPVTGLMIAKANIHLQWTRDELPPTGTGTDWATLSDRPSIMDDGADSRLVNEGD